MRTFLLSRLLVCALVLPIESCAFLDLRPDRSSPDEFRDALGQKKGLVPPLASKRFQPPPPAVTDALLPDLPVPHRKGARVARMPRFDISVMHADAREFFMGLVADSDYNVMVHPEVKGTITVSLKGVTLPEVLDAVREIYGYDYKKTDAGYIIYPAELMSRIYHVDYLNFVRNGRSETRVSTGQSSQLQRGGSATGQTNFVGGGLPPGQGGYGGIGGSGSGYLGGASDEAEEYMIDCRAAQAENGQQAAGSAQLSRSSSGRGGLPYLPGSVIATASTSHFWKEMRQALNVIVCSGQGANFVVNQQTGVIVVHAFPKQLREVEQFLEAIKREVQRQVVLEAKILEVVLKDGYQAGINWASVIRAGEKAILTSLAGPLAGTVSALGSGVGDVFTIGINMGDFSAFIELLETQGEVHTLSSPRIATLNNQKAVIKVGSDQFFVTNVSNTIVAGSASTLSTPSIELTPFFSGIALDVTPQIDDAGMVTLHVHPSVTEVEDSEKRIRVGGEEQVLPTALSTVRESDSVVHAENGQIVVIGGLMQNVEKNSRQGVAWLSRIPGLGSLFRRGKGDFQKSELVILLKPMIIQDQADWMRAGKDTTERFNRLEGESRQEVLP